jgi:Sec7-like guanine-nucleotide exchange factor
LCYFSLPGEAQQIDRVVTVFSEEYCLQNPTTLCGNSSYLLAYGLIMLQTDAHNPNVEKKMEFSTFAGMFKYVKVKDTEQIPEEFLTDLYNSVKEFPLAVLLKTKKKSDL